jgi:two-component system, LytTR family, response regulator
MKTSGFKIQFPKVRDIEYMYVFKGFTILELQCGGQDVIDMPLCEVERQLDDERLFRIHKSYVVNLKRVRELEVKEDQITIQVNGRKLPVSRRRKQALLKVLSGKKVSPRNNGHNVKSTLKEK